MLDLDGFEAFNDTHGLAAGDLALRAIGGLLLRSHRLPFRGGEFTLLLPNATLEYARGRLERLRQALAVLPLRGGGEELPPLSASPWRGARTGPPRPRRSWPGRTRP